MVNSPLLLQGWAQQQIIKYLQTNPPKRPLAVVAITPAGVREVHSSTTDVAALIEAVRKLPTQFTHHESGEAVIPHLDQDGRIDSYASLMNALQERNASVAARA